MTSGCPPCQARQSVSRSQRRISHLPGLSPAPAVQTSPKVSLTTTPAPSDCQGTQQFSPKPCWMPLPVLVPPPPRVARGLWYPGPQQFARWAQVEGLPLQGPKPLHLQRFPQAKPDHWPVQPTVPHPPPCPCPIQSVTQNHHSRQASKPTHYLSQSVSCNLNNNAVAPPKAPNAACPILRA